MRFSLPNINLIFREILKLYFVFFLRFIPILIDISVINLIFLINLYFVTTFLKILILFDLAFNYSDCDY